MPPAAACLRKLLCLFAGVSLAATAPAFARPAANRSCPPPSEAVQRLGQAFVSADQADALSIAILHADCVSFFNFGSVTPGIQAPPTQNNVYEIGSVTKLFTSLLLAHAVQEGKIGLQDDIRLYLPAAYPNLEADSLPIRIIDLVDTTSALPDNLPDFAEVTAPAPEAQKAFLLAKVLTAYTRQDLLRDLHSVTLRGRPGTEPRHSNLAAELLGEILATVYREPFPALLQATILDPLGMKNGVAPVDPSLIVQGYDAHHVAMPATNQAAVLAAGGLRFSTRDMARFLQAELAADDPAIRLTQQPAFGTLPSAAIAFQWQLSRNVEGALKLNASGGTAGAASYVEIYPGRRLGLVLLANRSGETEGRLYGLADSLFAATEGTPALDALRTALERSRFAHVERSVRRIRHQFPNLTLSEVFLNNWAGGLLDVNPKEALALFQYIVQQWPDSSNAFDSLGDGYAQSSDRPAAIRAYRRALELNPENQEASASLATLTGATKHP